MLSALNKHNVMKRSGREKNINLQSDECGIKKNYYTHREFSAPSKMSSIFSSTSAVVVYHSLITTQKYIF
jgi:hypothetical protein